jgi:hypothetical protein
MIALGRKGTSVQMNFAQKLSATRQSAMGIHRGSLFLLWDKCPQEFFNKFLEAFLLFEMASSSAEELVNVLANHE